jgi:hypothetical protein
MPGDAPTRHERGEPEGGDARPELDDEEGERRDQQEQHEQLTELDAHIERQQRRDEMRPGKLQRVAQRERKPDPWIRPNPNATAHRWSNRRASMFSRAM